MTLEEFARIVLFGTRLEDKLIQVELETPVENVHPAIDVPSFPGRPAQLAKPGKAQFPSVNRLHEASERGKVLHFFANHELLAMELMALVLLRFPEAPVAFRRGVAGVIQEEQNHLRLYLSRMKELGITFGDLPVNDYFWNSMKTVRSPLDFTVQMSLTFEQANLDFSLFFMKAVAAVGDEVTANILERVFREEIGHVKHGLAWFNRWRENATSENEWEAYVKHLPFPLTPQRAKGFEFCEEARRQAGFSETFIRELGVYSGSKGRPPVVWVYNPHCDSEIARGKVGFSPTEGARLISQDLETVPVFLSLDKDVVLVQNRPRTEWIESLQRSGFRTPEIVEIKDQDFFQSIKAPKIGGIEPWGWSPDIFQKVKPLRSRLVDVDGGNSPFCKKILDVTTFEETGLGKLFSKAWSVLYLREWIEAHPESQSLFGGSEWVGSPLKDWDSVSNRIQEILFSGNSVMVKAPYGTSGMQVRKIQEQKELQGPVAGWIKKVLSSQGAIIVEPGLNRLFDLSIQMEITDSRIQLLEARQFIVGSRHEYRGTYLSRKMPGLEAEHHQFFHQAISQWHSFLRNLGEKLRDEGYRGPAGVDAFLWKDENGNLKLKPLVELNPRWTMGRVALELEKQFAPGTSGVWLFIPLREIKSRGYESADLFAQELQRKYPLKIRQINGNPRIESGVVFTNDPMNAKSVLTILASLPNPDLAEFGG
jgi:uncharacterized ferritin-like protein (DUF455 family)